MVDVILFSLLLTLNAIINLVEKDLKTMEIPGMTCQLTGSPIFLIKIVVNLPCTLVS